MNRTIKYDIPKEFSGKTIEQFLRRKGYTNSGIVQLKKMHKSILVDGTWKRMRDVLNVGQQLVVCIKEEEVENKILPINLPFAITYEDEDVVVVNKPANMPIHPSIKNYDNTLANALMAYYEGQNFVFRCVNRLDRDTTGLSIVAKHSVSVGILYQSMERREIHRIYYAIVEDKIHGDLPDEGEMDFPIGRVSHSCIERMVDFENGEYAYTHFWTLWRGQNRALVKLKLGTGRTHQIRVHMSYIGHPLLGDGLYNHGESGAWMERTALHSKALSFIQPMTGQEINLEIDLPEDMKRCLKKGENGNEVFY